MEKKIKTFVLDTNVLIHDPNCIFSFADNRVVIPLPVIEELDGFKRLNDEKGLSARLIARQLDSLRSQGKIFKGVKLKTGGTLSVAINYKTELPYEFVTSQVDHRLLGICLLLRKKGEKVIFITKDVNLRIKAEALGIDAQDYEKEKIKFEELYIGWRELKVPGEKIDSFYKRQELKIEKDLLPNEGIILRDENNSSKTALAKYSFDKKAIVPLYHVKSTPWGLKPYNTEQRFALELLLCDNVKLVTLIGVPGAGKTLLSLACGLHKTIEDKKYRRLFISRPIFPVGRDIGYLPGSKEEKLTSWMGAIYDNLEFLIDHNHPDEKTDEKIQFFLDTGKIEIDSLTYIRGRSLPSQFIIIDDAQNLTPHEVKTIISRAGEGTKIVLTGDPYQIDNPYLDASSNGLIYIVERFKNQEIFGSMKFTKTERSDLASLASKLL